jgi:hypothetical protein
MDSVIYRSWLIEATQQPSGYTFRCYASLPGNYSSPEVYSSPESAIDAAQGWVDQTLASKAVQHCHTIFQAGQLAIEDLLSIEEIILGTVLR